MAQPTTLTMSDLIDETLDYLSRYGERPGRVVVGATAPTSSLTSILLTLSEGSDLVNPSDLLEFGSELLLVVAKSSDVDPVFTVARGYLGTTPAAHATGDVGGLNPLYPRYQVQRAIERCFSRLSKHLPFIDSAVYTTVTGKRYVEMEANTITVLEVGYMDPAPSDFTGVSTDRYTVFGGWVFERDMPASIVASSAMLRTPSWVRDDQDLVVKRQIPYAWSDTPAAEDSTIAVPVGADELPVLFATARLVTGREISRSELDKVEEWNHEAAIRGGVNIRLLQGLWADFYRAIDEVRGTHHVPKHRPYIKMAGTPQRRPWIQR